MCQFLKEIAFSLKLMEGMREDTMHNDSKVYYKACDACQRIGRPSQRDEFPLQTQVSLQPFEKWVIDFVGPIQPLGKKRIGHYIIIATECLTR